MLVRRSQFCPWHEQLCWIGLQQRHWLDGHHYQPEQLLKRVHLISNGVAQRRQRNKRYERSIRNFIITGNITPP